MDVERRFQRLKNGLTWNIIKNSQRRDSDKKVSFVINTVVINLILDDVADQIKSKMETF